MKTLPIFIISFFLSCATLAQPVTALADRDSILIGEKIKLQLKAFYTQGQQPVWFQIDTIPHFEIMEKLKADTQRYNNDLIITQALILTSWDSGTWYIPSLRLPQGNTQPIKIEVGHTPFDVTQPYNDIHDILDVKTTHTTNWFWYFLLLIVLIALYFIFFNKEKKDEEPVSEIDPDAHTKAIQRLEQLRNSGLADKDTKAFYTELINIFRWYVQASKGIVSFSRTTSDLAIQLQTLPLSNDQFNELVQTLRLSDMVKFARYRPVKEEMQQSFSIIKTSVDEIDHTHAV